MQNAEKYLNLPKLGKDDTFTFGCNNCGTCCRNREDILLTPLDLFKMAKHLDKHITEVITEYCETYEGHSSKLPIVRIKPREYRLTCPFSKREGCLIHPVKPSVCAAYPLGRMTNYLTNEFTYFVMPVTCGNKVQTQTVRQWLADFSLLEEEDFTKMWHCKTFELSDILCGLYDKLCFSHDVINSALLINLYIKYDLQKDFMPQFVENCEAALRLTKIIAEKASEFMEEGTKNA